MVRRDRILKSVMFERLEARCLMTSIPIDGTPITLSGIKAGDTVTIRALVTTAVDANENGEGESLVVSSVAPAGQPTSVSGIDISHYQGKIDWTKVAAQGDKFVVIKATQGVGVDRLFVQNIGGAADAGLTVGAYHFAAPNLNIKNLTQDAAAEAQNYVRTVGGFINSGVVSLQPVLDLEDGSAPNQHKGGGCIGLTPKQLAQWSKNWIDDVTAALPGVTVSPILYMDQSHAKGFSGVSPSLTSYPLWLADYSASDPINNPDPNLDTGPWPNYSMIQFSKTGSTNGVKGPTDLDILNPNIDLSSLKLSGGSGEFSATDSTFNVTVPYTFLSRGSDITISASIPNGDGDESATVSADFTSTPNSGLAPTQRQSLTKAASNFSIAATGIAVVAKSFASETSIIKQSAASAAWTLSGLFGAASAALSNLSNDPSDTNYKLIAHPARLVTTIYSQSKDFAGLKNANALTGSINTLESNEQRIIAFARAAYLTENRLQGATDAGDLRFERLQLSLFKQYKTQISKLLAEFSGLTQRVAMQLDKAGLGDTAASDIAVHTFEEAVLNNGLPDTLSSTLNALGISNTIQSQIQQILFVQDTKIAAGSYDSILNNPSTLLELNSTAYLLRFR